MKSFTYKKVFSSLSAYFISLILVLAGIKFGSVIYPAGIGFYPLSLLEWVMMPWPPALASVLSGIALFLSLLSSKKLEISTFLDYKHFLLPSFSLWIVSFIGLLRTTEYDYAVLFLWHTLAISNFVLAVFIHLTNSPRTKKLFCIAISLGTLCCILSGLLQVMSGFEDTKEYALALAKEKGHILPADLKSRLFQTRVYATFTYPNSYAAHLIATLPILIFLLWKYSERISPPRLSQVFFSLLGIVFGGLSLYWTGSRGAFCAIFIAIVTLSMLEWKVFKTWKQHYPSTFYSVLYSLLIVGGYTAFLLFRGKTSASIGARWDYYNAAISMFFDHPFVGVGLGEFFPWYGRIKPIEAEETRLVHNLWLHFVSQCGILGGIASGYFLAQPILLGIFTKRKNIIDSSPWILVCLLGCLSWNYHAIVDFNSQIPGTFMTVAIIPLLIIRFKNRTPYSSATSTLTSNVLVIVLFFLAILGTTAAWRLPGEKAYQKFIYQCESENDLILLQLQAEEVATLLPFSPYHWEILGKLALDQKNYPLAQYAFEEACQRTPHRSIYHFLLSQCFFVQGDIEKAKMHIREAILWYPNKSEIHVFNDYIKNNSP